MIPTELFLPSDTISVVVFTLRFAAVVPSVGSDDCIVEFADNVEVFSFLMSEKNSVKILVLNSQLFGQSPG